MFSCSPFFLFGKDGDFLSAKNTFPEASGNALPTFKCFPNLRETPCRRLSAFRTFGKPRADGKMLSETSGSPAPTEKRFPKLREVPRRRKSTFRNFGKLRADGKALSEATEYLLLAGNTKKAATINLRQLYFFL